MLDIRIKKGSSIDKHHSFQQGRSRTGANAKLKSVGALASPVLFFLFFFERWISSSKCVPQRAVLLLLSKLRVLEFGF